MQSGRSPTVIGISMLLIVVGLGGLLGCATTGPSSSAAAAPPGKTDLKIYFEIQSTGRNVATIFINGEERGDTPVHVRADMDGSGGLADDLVIKAAWDGGSNETEFTIPRGSRPQAIIRVGPSGEREY
jgi:hypothetical protein